MKYAHFLRDAAPSLALILLFWGSGLAFGAMPPKANAVTGLTPALSATDEDKPEVESAELADGDQAEAEVSVDESQDESDESVSAKQGAQNQEPGSKADEKRSEKSKKEDKGNQGKGDDRRSRVATAVQALLAVADREGGIGEQVREIAKSQQNSHGEAEDALEQAKERKGWVKFLIGPNYKQISLVEDRLEEINQQLEELKDLRGKLTNPEDSTLLDSQVQAIAQLQSELQSEVEDSKKGFSLFGWLAKFFSK